MTEIQNEYCIGFLLPKKIQFACEHFATTLEKQFTEDFVNKLSQRPPHIKLKKPFRASVDELEKLFTLLSKFAENQKPLELFFDTVLFYDEDKVALSVSLDDKAQLDEVQIDLCFMLSQVFPGRSSNKTEPVFIPRVTLGFYKGSHTVKIANNCYRLFDKINFQNYLIREIVLFERSGEDGSYWKSKVTFKLKKKVPAII